MLTAVRQAVR